ncbi:MAG: OB-fold nucleic acid binding domain-containing protein [Planctomycetota bacterium]
MQFNPKRVLRFSMLIIAAFAMCFVAWQSTPPAEAADSDRVELDRGTPYIVAAGRSPIPAAGEDISEPLPFKRLIDDRGSKVKPKRPDGPVAWGAAHNYIGQRITVEGKIVDTYNHNGNICFLNFHKDWRGKFYIPVFKEVFDDLPRAPEKYYLGKTIRVTGKVTQHKNRPNIEVRNIKQIEIVD